jgi:putative ABC transport system permease protein
VLRPAPAAALLLSGLGSVAGIILGILLAYVLTRYFGSTYYAASVGFGIDWPIVLASALVGLLAPPLAALPAIRRAVRVPVRDALEATGSAVGGQDAADRLLARVRFLPRPAQIGLRNVGRRRRRSLSTALVIALAVGTLLAVLGLATAAANASRASWGDHGEDVNIIPVSGRSLDARAEALIRATPGVAAVEPHFVTDITLAGKAGRIWGVRRCSTTGSPPDAGTPPPNSRPEPTSPSSSKTSPAPPEPGSATPSPSRPPPDRPASS